MTGTYVDEFRLDAVALEATSQELHRMLGLRPCLYVPALFDRAVVSMEPEVGGAVALLMRKGLSGKPPMYAEIFTVDEVENCVLIGHAEIRVSMDGRHALDNVFIERFWRSLKCEDITLRDYVTVPDPEPELCCSWRSSSRSGNLGLSRQDSHLFCPFRGP